MDQQLVDLIQKLADSPNEEARQIAAALSYLCREILERDRIRNEALENFGQNFPPF